MPIPNGQASDDQLIVESQAAELLKLSCRTLQAWRPLGIGPPYVRVGRAIRYRRGDLIAWIKQNTVAPRQPV